MKRVGVVRSVHAVRRELRVNLEGPYRAWIETAGMVFVAIANEEPVPCRVQGVRFHLQEAIVQLTPGVPRDLIGRMRHAAVLASEDSLLETDTTPIKASELIGFRVVGVDGLDLGEITDVYETAYNAAIQVESEHGRPFLLPLVNEVVDAVDAESSKVFVRDIAGFAVEEGVDDAD